MTRRRAIAAGFIVLALVAFGVGEWFGHGAGRVLGTGVGFAAAFAAAMVLYYPR